MERATRVATLLVAGALLLPVIVGLGGAWYVFSRPEAQASEVVLHVSAPDRVLEGDKLELAVDIDNHTGRTIRLRGIDVGGSYLDGFVMIRTVPDYDTGEEDALFHSYTFGQDIPAGGTTRVVFRLQAVAAGEYRGDVDVRLSGATGLLTGEIRTAVAAPGGPGLDPTGPSQPGGDSGGDPGGDPLIIQPAEETP